MKKTIGLVALVISAATALVPAALARDWDDHDSGRGRYNYQVQTRTDRYQRAYNHRQREWMPQDRYAVRYRGRSNYGRSDYQRNRFER